MGTGGRLWRVGDLNRGRDDPGLGTSTSVSRPRAGLGSPRSSRAFGHGSTPVLRVRRWSCLFSSRGLSPSRLPPSLPSRRRGRGSVRLPGVVVVWVGVVGQEPSPAVGQSLRFIWPRTVPCLRPGTRDENGEGSGNHPWAGCRRGTPGDPRRQPVPTGVVPDPTILFDGDRNPGTGGR